jgi:D-threonate/D-erythronate kinase
VLIVADDLTGAADAAAAFAVAGHSCRVALGVNGESDESDVLAIDTHSRAMAEADAFVATVAAIQRHPERRVFIKIDSTMRGHVRTIVDAALEALPTRPSRIVVCPAFPSRGRTVVDGCVLVDDEPLASGSIRDAFTGFKGRNGLFIPTVRTDDDLAALVRTVDDEALWVGSAGLARHLARRNQPSGRASVTRLHATWIVVVAGSKTARTLEQLSMLDMGAIVERVDPRDRTLGQRLLPIIGDADGIVLTGGYTARTVLELLGIDSLQIGGEVEPGIPWAIARSGDRALAVITKAGGFGDELSLQRAVDFLAQS